MNPVSVVTGTMAPLDRADVDTDQIMPKQFLKRIERTGFGEFVFHDWRADPDFVLNDLAHAAATVLVTGPNFGSGSSREHAPWGLQQYGFQAIVAPSFADIFSSNCAKIGLLCVVLHPQTVKDLLALAAAEPATRATVDLRRQLVTAGRIEASFEFDAHTRYLLMNGLDAIGLTLERHDAIDDFERRRPAWLPTTV